MQDALVHVPSITFGHSCVSMLEIRTHFQGVAGRANISYESHYNLRASFFHLASNADNLPSRTPPVDRTERYYILLST